MGADSLFSFPCWNGPEESVAPAMLVVAVRDHVDREALDAQIRLLTEQFDARIEKLDTPNIDISSKTLRSWVDQEKSLRYYVKDSVIQYIEEHNLYKGCEL